MPSEPAEVRTGGPRPGGTPAPSPAPRGDRGAGGRGGASPARCIRSCPAPAPRAGRTSGARARADVEPAPDAGRPNATRAGAGPAPRRPTRARPSSRHRAHRAGAGRDGRRGGVRPAPEPGARGARGRGPTRGRAPSPTSPVEVTRFEHPSPSEAATDPAIDLLASSPRARRARCRSPPTEPPTRGTSPVEAVARRGDPPPCRADALLPSEEASHHARAAELPGKRPRTRQDAVEIAAASDSPPTPTSVRGVRGRAGRRRRARGAPARSLAERIDAAVDATEGLEAGAAAPVTLPSASTRPSRPPSGPRPGAAATGDPCRLLGGSAGSAARGARSGGPRRHPARRRRPGDGARLRPATPPHRALRGGRDPPRGRVAVEPELGGQPDDPVPLAALHEFVGEQPVDPRALAFDDQGEQPTLAPEDLQATEAELADARRTRSSPRRSRLPEPRAGAGAASRRPAAPRIAVPGLLPAPAARAPRRGRDSSPVPRRLAPPPAPAAARRCLRAAGHLASGHRTSRRRRTRLPALSAARPEPPRARAPVRPAAARSRGHKAVLLAPAPLDVMEEDGR